ncbi:alpha/beta fold hydrolase [Vibrio methylphosphonaticus]|uniref:alpha/beta fold hydrolase n=1 Tax=Vibrio methylphosphonaticus TaxID=2946866 RepID=UPI00202A47D8|nr:alpha/beta hydrolase [Vibrio methylphosphonaticus]MCL9774924.1 alpha/beta hydrolase [Vibrio methylphosphonaticus]
MKREHNLEQYYETYGVGRPIVMIHGSYATTSTWKRMLTTIPSGYRCILIKLPGHCGTPDPTDFGQAMVETELSIIEAIIEKECDEPIHLIGHSYGGVVALALALKGPVKLSQLSLLEPVATWVLELENDQVMLTVIEEFLKDYRLSVEKKQSDACGKVIDFWSANSEFSQFPSEVKQKMATLVSNNLRHWDICTTVPAAAYNLASMTVPTDILVGGLSNNAAHAIAAHLNALLPNARYCEVPGARHSLVVTHATECAEVMFPKRATQHN